MAVTKYSEPVVESTMDEVESTVDSTDDVRKAVMVLAYHQNIVNGNTIAHLVQWGQDYGLFD